MIIPIRCFTCGNILASKFDYYKKNIKNIKESNIIDINNIKNDNNYNKLMKDIGLKRYCCIRHFLGQLDMLEKIK